MYGACHVEVLRKQHSLPLKHLYYIYNITLLKNLLYISVAEAILHYWWITHDAFIKAYYIVIGSIVCHVEVLRKLHSFIARLQWIPKETEVHSELWIGNNALTTQTMQRRIFITKMKPYRCKLSYMKDKCACLSVIVWWQGYSLGEYIKSTLNRIVKHFYFHVTYE